MLSARWLLLHNVRSLLLVVLVGCAFRSEMLPVFTEQPLHSLIVVTGAPVMQGGFGIEFEAGPRSASLGLHPRVQAVLPT